MTPNDFSQSELVTLSLCPRKWFWQYGNCLKRRGMWNWNFVVGTEFHTFLETFYKGLPFDKVGQFNPKVDLDVLKTGKWTEQFTFWRIVFPALVEAYVKTYPREYMKIDPQDVENIQIREFEGIIFRGKIDVRGTRSNVPVIMDHKTCSSLIEQGDKLNQRFQFLFYFWLSGLTDGEFIVNWIKKPSQRQGKKETATEFACRVRAEILESPGDYFKRESVYFSKAQIKHFEEKVLLPKIKKLKLLLEPSKDTNFLFSEMNLEACHSYNSPCPFIPLCFEDEALATVDFVKKTSKHEELESE